MPAYYKYIYIYEYITQTQAAFCLIFPTFWWKRNGSKVFYGVRSWIMIADIYQDRFAILLSKKLINDIDVTQFQWLNSYVIYIVRLDLERCSSFFVVFFIIIFFPSTYAVSFSSCSYFFSFAPLAARHDYVFLLLWAMSRAPDAVGMPGPEHMPERMR